MTKPVYASTRNLTPMQRIMMATGRRPVECKCAKCKMQCRTPCLGTPHDILRLVKAGYGERVAPTDWIAGMVLGVIDRPVLMVQPIQEDTDDGGTRCTFFHGGLCELHDLGLKPTEGRLSHHSTRLDNFKRNKSISWNVAKEWLSSDNLEIIKEISERWRRDDQAKEL